MGKGLPEQKGEEVEGTHIAAGLLLFLQGKGASKGDCAWVTAWDLGWGVAVLFRATWNKTTAIAAHTAGNGQGEEILVTEWPSD